MMNVNTTLGPCTHLLPSCLIEAPGYYTIPRTIFNLSKPWCGEGKIIYTWSYNYKSCKLNRIHQLKDESSLFCLCVENLFEECQKLSKIGPCNSIFYSTASIQLVVILFGMIMNAIIVRSFYRRRIVRKKIPNILLFNQALADLFNGCMYGFTHLVSALLSFVQLEGNMTLNLISTLCFVVSLSSSIFMYTTIASERFIALYLPLFHKTRLRKKHVWMAVAASWSGAVIIAATYNFNRFFKFSTVIDLIIEYLMYLMVAIISFLFMITFIKAFRSIHVVPSQTFQDINIVNLKKHLRLTAVFFAMFMAFAVAYIPKVLFYRLVERTVVMEEIVLTLLLLTSVFNPMLTLNFKREFLPYARRSQIHRLRETNGNIELQKRPSSSPSASTVTV